MARRFNGTSAFLTTPSLLAINGAQTASISFWGYRDVSTKPISVGFLREDGHRFGIIVSPKDGGDDPKIYGIAEKGGNISQGWFKSALIGWHHFSFTYDGNASGNSNRLIFYLDGVEQALSFNGTIPSELDGDVNYTGFDIGRYGDVGQRVFTDGCISEVSVWITPLTFREHMALSKGINPSTVRLHSLIYLNSLKDLWMYDCIRGLFHTEVGPTSHAADPTQIIRPYKFKMIYGIPEFIFRRIRMSLKKVYNPRKIIFQAND